MPNVNHSISRRRTFCPSAPAILPPRGAPRGPVPAEDGPSPSTTPTRTAQQLFIGPWAAQEAADLGPKALSSCPLLLSAQPTAQVRSPISQRHPRLHICKTNPCLLLNLLQNEEAKKQMIPFLFLFQQHIYFDYSPEVITFNN